MNAPIAVILNRDAGSLGGGRMAAARARILAVAERFNVSIEIIEARCDHVGIEVRRALKQGRERIVVGGGDGSIGTAARILHRSDAVLGVLPLGTRNHFVRDCGLPLDLDAAAAIALVGRPRAVDLASVNGRPFVNNAVAGVYPRVVRARDWQRSRMKRPKYWAMAISAIQAVRWFRTLKIAVAAAGSLLRTRTPLVFVGNNEYTLAPWALPKRGRLDGGRLCLYLLSARSPWQAFLITCRVLFRGVRTERDFVHVNEPELTLLSPKRRLRMALDGEVAYFRPPLRFKSLPGRLALAAELPEECS